jgi:hypothetical protein
MALHIAYQYWKGPAPVLSADLVFSVTQFPAPPGSPVSVNQQFYDFKTDTFVPPNPGPFMPTSGLPGGGPLGNIYSAVLQPTPWPDGEYQVRILDANAGNTVVRVLYAEMVSADDGFSIAPDGSSNNPSVIGTTLDRIVKDIRQMVSDSKLFGNMQCVISLEEPWTPAYQGFPMAVFRPMNAVPMEGQVAGGGRYSAGMQGTYRVTIQDANLVDPNTQDYVRLLDVNRGILRLAHRLVDVLELYIPLDAAGNALTEEPSRLINQSSPGRISGGSQTWTSLAMEFEIRFQRALTLG